MKARLASGNPHKLVELRRALPGWEIELVEERDFPPEDGSTYEENARGKAQYGRGSAPPDAWAIGEDSGIEAAALGGRPGIASARWAEDGVERMLAELDGVADRGARYVCVIVAVAPAGDEVVVRGTLEGRIATGAQRRRGLRLRPDLRPGRRGADGRRARQRLEGVSLASCARRRTARCRASRAGRAKRATG